MNRQQRRAAEREAGGRTAVASPLVREAMGLHQAGQLDRAQALYQRALAAQPDDADALYLLGFLRRQRGDLAGATGLMQRALAVRPNFPEAQAGLGDVLASAGRREAAAEAYRTAIALRPRFAEAHAGLAAVLNDLGKREDALSSLRRALELRPDMPEWRANLGAALTQLGRHEEAVSAYRQAIALRSDLPEAHYNLGYLLDALQRPAEAAEAFRHAIALNPNHAEATYNLGNSLRDLGQLEDAIAAHRRAIALKPDLAAAHHNLGMELLLAGRLREGFEEYRWRLRIPDWGEAPARPDIPAWDGEDLTGKTILVQHEQGFGDSLQFIRYVRPLARMAGRVMVLAQPPLAGLFASIGAVDILTEPPGADVRADYRVWMMCLPRLLETDAQTVPAEVPYLAASPAKVARWAGRLGPASDRLRVGLVWAGASRKHDPKANAIDRRRSLTLESLAPLAEVPGVEFVSLQMGEPAEQARQARAGLRLIDLTAEIGDFEDTAALIGHLDLVISVDTSVAHLAGALGKPVWMLNRFDTCWRWLREGETSAWYPSLRQFRQPAPGDWTPVIAAVREALARLANGAGP
jgi:tetratricopeptide (TPR) repeat protein